MLVAHRALRPRGGRDGETGPQLVGHRLFRSQPRRRLARNRPSGAGTGRAPRRRTAPRCSTISRPAAATPARSRSCSTPSAASVDFEPPPEARLPRTLWGVGRGTRAEAGQAHRAEDAGGRALLRPLDPARRRCWATAPKRSTKASRSTASAIRSSRRSCPGACRARDGEPRHPDLCGRNRRGRWRESADRVDGPIDARAITGASSSLKWPRRVRRSSRTAWPASACRDGFAEDQASGRSPLKRPVIDSSA